MTSPLLAPRLSWQSPCLQPPCQATAADRTCHSATYRGAPLCGFQHLLAQPRRLSQSRQHSLCQRSTSCMRHRPIDADRSVSCLTTGQPASLRPPCAAQRRGPHSPQLLPWQSIAPCSWGGAWAAARTPRAPHSSRRTDSQAPADTMMLLGDAVMLLSTEFVRPWTLVPCSAAGPQTLWREAAKRIPSGFYPALSRVQCTA